MNKQIVYDRQNRDWAAYLDGEYIGSYKSDRAAQSELDRLALVQAKQTARRAALDEMAVRV